MESGLLHTAQFEEDELDGDKDLIFCFLDMLTVNNAVEAGAEDEENADDIVSFVDGITTGT